MGYNSLADNRPYGSIFIRFAVVGSQNLRIPAKFREISSL